MIGIHREGFRWIGIALLIGIIISILFWYLPIPPLVGWVAWAAGMTWIIILLQFFRVPKRLAGTDPQRLYSPADGKVVVVEKTNVSEWLDGEYTQISVFMSPVNVHINWYPVSAEVSYYKYHPGAYLVAWHPKSSELNERSAVGLTLASGEKLLLRQVAGVLARKIVCYAKVGEKAEPGNEMGFIKFGSRVDLFVPTHWEILVKPGDKVIGSISALARITSENA
jgi:phosphatidylserine decarboxylase